MAERNLSVEEILAIIKDYPNFGEHLIHGEESKTGMRVELTYTEDIKWRFDIIATTATCDHPDYMDTFEELFSDDNPLSDIQMILNRMDDTDAIKEIGKAVCTIIEWYISGEMDTDDFKLAMRCSLYTIASQYTKILFARAKDIPTKGVK